MEITDMRSLRNMLSLITICIMMINPLSMADDVDNTPLILTFGTYANDRPTVISHKIKPVLRKLEHLLSESLDKDVIIKLHLTKTQEDTIRLLSTGTFDIVRFDPVAYINAKRTNPNLRIAAIELIDGAKLFYGVFVTQMNSEIYEITDIANKNVAFGAEHSTVGRFLAQQFLVKNNITSSDLHDFSYINRNDKVGIAVATGKYDIGVIREDTFKLLLSVGYNLIEIDRFPNVTESWVVSDHLSPNIYRAIETSLASITDSDTLYQLGIDGFTTGTDTDYDLIRNSIIDNSMFFIN